MTSGSAAGVRLLVVGVDLDGTEVTRLGLGHGDDPNALLALQGWDVLRVRDVTRDPDDRRVLTMTFVVEPCLTQPDTVAPLVNEVQSPPSDVLAGQVIAEGLPFRHQRVAAYAVVTSSRGVLVTQFSDRTGAEGQWGLPGGGLEAEEEPSRAVVREVWEESGQVVELSDLALIQTSRWIGRAPAGRLEDFHAVRVVYRAFCLQPTEPVVHDVGGTTASAAWLLPAELDLLALTSSWRSILLEVTGLGESRGRVSDVVMASDQADGPDDHHHHTEADNRPRTEP